MFRTSASSTSDPPRPSASSSLVSCPMPSKTPSTVSGRVAPPPRVACLDDTQIFAEHQSTRFGDRLQPATTPTPDTDQTNNKQSFILKYAERTIDTAESGGKLVSIVSSHLRWISLWRFVAPLGEVEPPP